METVRGMVIILTLGQREWDNGTTRVVWVSIKNIYNPHSKNKSLILSCDTNLFLKKRVANEYVYERNF